MKNCKTAVIAMLCLIFSSIALAQNPSAKCGTWRWNVKTLTDQAGAPLLSKKAVPVSIEALSAEKPPKVLHSDSHSDGQVPRYPNESQVVEIVALVVEVKQEDGDRDLHFVLKSTASGKTMVAEIPDPTCPDFDNFPQLRAWFTRTRQDGYAIRDKWKKSHKPVKVKITGVPFWDGVHSTMPTGASRYCREIHPVISMVPVN